jgi:hypothetical protein
MITGDGACIACIDTSLELVVHDFSLNVAAGRWLFYEGATWMIAIRCTGSPERRCLCDENVCFA